MYSTIPESTNDPQQALSLYIHPYTHTPPKIPLKSHPPLYTHNSIPHTSLTPPLAGISLSTISNLFKLGYLLLKLSTSHSPSCGNPSAPTLGNGFSLLLGLCLGDCAVENSFALPPVLNFVGLDGGGGRGAEEDPPVGARFVAGGAEAEGPM